MDGIRNSSSQETYSAQSTARAGSPSSRAAVDTKPDEIKDPPSSRPQDLQHLSREAEKGEARKERDSRPLSPFQSAWSSAVQGKRDDNKGARQSAGAPPAREAPVRGDQETVQSAAKDSPQERQQAGAMTPQQQMGQQMSQMTGFMNSMTQAMSGMLTMMTQMNKLQNGMNSSGSQANNTTTNNSQNTTPPSGSGQAAQQMQQMMQTMQQMTQSMQQMMQMMQKMNGGATPQPPPNNNVSPSPLPPNNNVAPSPTPPNNTINPSPSPVNNNPKPLPYKDGDKIKIPGTEGAFKEFRIGVIGNPDNIKNIYFVNHGDGNSDYFNSTKSDRQAMAGKLPPGTGAIVAYPISPTTQQGTFAGGKNGEAVINAFRHLEKLTGNNDVKFEQFSLSGGGRVNNSLMETINQKYGSDPNVKEFVDNHLRGIHDGDSLCRDIPQMKKNFKEAMKNFPQVRFSFIHNTSGKMGYVQGHQNELASYAKNGYRDITNGQGKVTPDKVYNYGGSTDLENGRLRFWSAPTHWKSWAGQFEKVFFG
ncbi:MAG: hypothetical protein RDV48_27365 [Candidatus Eremiobacteraeota bacterium]|nr:hypothetical protein [Candidatus Eremiobacteraeota bacterium]